MRLLPTPAPLQQTVGEARHTPLLGLLARHFSRWRKLSAQRKR
jgi:hypothetical protein